MTVDFPEFEVCKHERPLEMSGRREQGTMNALCVLSRSPLPPVLGTRAGARAGTLARTHADEGAAVARRREKRGAANDAEAEA